MSRLIQALLDPRCYPHPVRDVRLIETHISWLLLTGSIAYKVKKPVKLPFVDFGSIDQRHRFCLEELRLNRRYAPALYLGVVAITGNDADPRVDGSGEPIEYAVKMLQFDQSDLMDRRLSTGNLTPYAIDDLADTCARFHAGAEIAPQPYGEPATVLAPAAANFATIREILPQPNTYDALARLERWTQEEFDRRTPHFIVRKHNGRIRECHGDLHLGNIALIEGKPMLFDCIEFDPALRWIDVMNEIAFVVMDLHARGHSDLGQRLLNRYLEASGDYAGVAVLAFYEVYRALVRAKVDCIRASQADLTAQGREGQWQDFSKRLALAETLARPERTFLAITCGLSGSGKTHVSQHVLERTRAIRIRSDVERKRLCGLAPCDPSGSVLEGGIYTAQANVLTFERLAALARTIIAAGYPVVIDAAFIRHERRKIFSALAAELGVPFAIIHCVASEALMAERIVRRQAEGRDASEATIDVLNRQKQHAEPLNDSEHASAILVDSDDALSIDAMVSRLVALER